MGKKNQQTHVSHACRTHELGRKSSQDELWMVVRLARGQAGKLQASQQHAPIQRLAGRQGARERERPPSSCLAASSQAYKKQHRFTLLFPAPHPRQYIHNNLHHHATLFSPSRQEQAVVCPWAAFKKD